jgi:hypothetical protein
MWMTNAALQLPLLTHIKIYIKNKSKANSVTGRRGPEICETSRLQHFTDNRLTDGSEGVIFMVCILLCVSDLRLSRRWLGRMPSSVMCRRVVLVWTDVSEERIDSIFRVEKSTNEKPAWGSSCRLSYQSKQCTKRICFKAVYSITLSCQYLILLLLMTSETDTKYSRTREDGSRKGRSFAV